MASRWCLLYLVAMGASWGCDHHESGHKPHDEVVDGGSRLKRLYNVFPFKSMNVRTHRHLGASDVPVEECGFRQPTKEEMQRDQEKMKWWKNRRSPRVDYDYTIPTYVHVLLPSPEQDIVPTSNVQTYMNYLNDAFATNTPFVFNLVEVTRTVNQNWSNNCRNGTLEQIFKTQLRRGGKESLNIYFCNISYAGYSYPPWNSGGVKDGVVLERTRPDDLRRPNTLVHEVGHFLGLLHTFGNCSSTDNDLVSDTPQHVSQAAAINCKTDKSTWDSCPALPGLDPVDNYMTYSNDNLCRTRFTTGQVDRMKAQFEIYRSNAPPSPPGKAPAPVPVPVRVPDPMPKPVAQPTVPPPTGPQCKFFLGQCNDNSDCCSGKCREFLFFPQFCRIF